MAPSSDLTPETTTTVARQRRNLKRLLACILVVAGLTFCGLGLRGLVTGEFGMAVHVKGRPKVPVTLQGAQAQWTSASFVAIGSGFLLSLLLVPHAIAAHFNRSGLFTMTLWQFGLLGTVALLFIGGLVGIAAGVIVP